MITTITDRELIGILKSHELWIETKGKEGKKAQLCNLDLMDIYLQEANLALSLIHI